jgi:hypothetical protein
MGQFHGGSIEKGRSAQKGEIVAGRVSTAG